MGVAVEEKNPMSRAVLLKHSVPRVHAVAAEKVKMRKTGYLHVYVPFWRMIPREHGESVLDGNRS